MARKKKFDTNPLEPDFPQKVAAEKMAWQETQTLPVKDAETRRFEEPSETEQQTRKFNVSDFETYQQPFNGQTFPDHQPSDSLHSRKEVNRKVTKVGLPENILIALPYIPFFIGLIAGLLELFFVPKSEAKVRFHAAQGTAAHIAILVITAILSGIGNITNLADLGNIIFKIVTTVMLIVFTIRAFQGKPIHIESVDELTNWLEDKIKPSD
jgi:uncharacterized membrane protein